MPRTPSVTPGQLNKRVTIQVRSAARDSANAPVNTWTDSEPVWARIAPMYQALTQSPGEFVSQATYRATFRWSRLLTLAVTNRVCWPDPSTGTVHLYEIKAVFPLDPDRPNTYVCALMYELDGAA